MVEAALDFVAEHERGTGAVPWSVDERRRGVAASAARRQLVARLELSPRCGARLAPWPRRSPMARRKRPHRGARSSPARRASPTSPSSRWTGTTRCSPASSTASRRARRLARWRVELRHPRRGALPLRSALGHLGRDRGGGDRLRPSRRCRDGEDALCHARRQAARRRRLPHRASSTPSGASSQKASRRPTPMPPC